MEEAAAEAVDSAPVESSASVGDGNIAPSSGDNLLGGSAPSAETTPEAVPDTQSTEVKSWHDTLPEEYRDNKNINKYNSLDEMLKGHVNLAKKVGEKGLEMPGEGADSAEWDKFYSRIGRPDSVDGYSDYSPEMVVDAEGNEVPAFEFDGDKLSEAKKRMHAVGATDKQMQEMMAIYADITTQAQNDIIGMQAQEAAATESELRREWGDKFEAKLRSSAAIAESLGIKDTLVNSGFGNNLDIIKALDKIGQRVGESKITGDASSSGGGFDQRLAALKSHPAAKSKGHPEYKSIQNQITELYKQKYSQ